MSGSMDGGIDSSIALNAGKTSTPLMNPLDTASRVLQLRQAQNQLALFPGQQQLQQQAVQGGQVDLATKNKNAAYNSLLPLLSLPAGSITHDMIRTGLASAENNGIRTQGVLADMANSPQGDGTGFENLMRARIGSQSQTDAGNALSSVIRQRGPTFDNGAYQLPTTTGAPSAVDANVPSAATAPIKQLFAPGYANTQDRVNIPLGPDGRPTGGGVPQGMSPEFLAQPIKVGVDPRTQAPIMSTQGEYLQRTGHLFSSPLGNGRMPAALLNGATDPNAPQPPGAPGGPAPGPITMGSGPGAEVALQNKARLSTEAFDQIRKQGTDAQNSGSTFGNMLADLKQFTPGQTKLNELQAFTQKYAPSLAPMTGATPEGVAAYESFNKLGHAIELSQGAGSDSRLSTAASANPNSSLSPAGADLMLRQLQGNADYNQAKAHLAANYPDQQDAAKFEDQVRQHLDPRAFQFARMTPAQKVTYGESLSATDRKTVGAAYKNALSQGLINAAQ